jgi:hypothetical protein
LAILSYAVDLINDCFERAPMILRSTTGGPKLLECGPQIVCILGEDRIGAVWRGHGTDGISSIVGP